MKHFIVLILLINALPTYAEFINIGVLMREQGHQIACDKSEEELARTQSLYEKAYYFSWKTTCHIKSGEFKLISKEERKKLWEINASKSAEALALALKSKEDLDNSLLDLLGVNENYPRINELLEKKKIKAYMERPVVAPDENEGDVHSVS
jgi:hypothetical protein